MKRSFLIAVFLYLFPLVAFSVEPSEILDDPALEERAREISKGLRCLVCQNESIDDSNASLAKDLRVLVRERILAGDSDAEVLNFVVNRYGEFALLKPSSSGSNLVLWLSGPFMLFLAIIISISFIRSNQRVGRNNHSSLSEVEKKALEKIINDQ